MNLEESDAFKEELERNAKRKKTVMILIGACGVTIGLIVMLIMYISYVDSITEKFFVDKKQTSTLDYKNIDGDVYVNVNQLGKILNYKYTKGKYKEYDADEQKNGYLTNKFEILELSEGENTYTKYLKLEANSKIAGVTVSLKSEQDHSETFCIEKPVKNIDGVLYAPLQYIPEMFNVQINWDTYRKNIYTLDYVFANVQKSIAGKYSEISGYYENIRGILDGYIVVGNGSQGKNGKLYGVYSLNDKNEIISIKYDDIKFEQSTKEFYITVSDGTMGILDKEGNRVVEPSEYQKISLLNDVPRLYLVKRDDECGVLNDKGEIVVYAENDNVGYDISKFKLTKIENKNFWRNKFIPVEKNKKYGLYEFDGDPNKPLLNTVYDGFGYISNAAKTSGNEQSVLFIPPEIGIDGIVINYDGKYGIYDLNKKEIIITCVCSKIYAITKSEKTTYYLEYAGQTYNLEDYLIENNLKDIDENNQYNDSNENNDSKSEKIEAPKEENTNIVNNNTTNSTTNTNTAEKSLNNNSTNNNTIANEE